MTDRIDSERNCRTCKHYTKDVDEDPCVSCELGGGNYRSPDYWTPKEEPKVIRGYCEECSSWATQNELLPCVENDEQSPPMTCGLLKPHRCETVEKIEDTLEVWPLDEGDHTERPVTFEDAKRRLVAQFEAGELSDNPPVTGRDKETFEEYQMRIRKEQAKQAEPPMWLEAVPEMSGDDPWDAEYLEEKTPEDTDGDYGWPDDTINLGPIASNGGSTSYYDLPQDASELNDLVEHKGMGFARGNVFKACYRIGEKSGTDIEYDIRKIIYFAERMLMAYQRGQHV